MAYVLNSTGRSRRRHRHCEDIEFASRSDEMSCVCRPECQQPRPPRNVIYTGPCPPDPECECQPPLPPPPCDPIWYRRESTDRPGFAHYAQTGALSVNAGEPIPLGSVVREASCTFSLEDNSVRICRYGTFLASFALTLPAASEVNTQIAIQLDGETIPGSTINVVKAPGSPGSAFVQAVFDVMDPIACLEVVSTSAMNLVGDTPLDTLASLTLVQVDGTCFDRKHDMDRCECGHGTHRRRCSCGH